MCSEWKQAQARVVELGRRGSDYKGGQQRSQPEVPGAGRVHWAVPRSGKTETQEERGRTGPCTPRAAPRTPSPTEATFSGKRGVPAQPLLAVSAAPQLAGEPAPEEGPAPPHLLATSLPLPFLSSGRAPPPPSSILPPPCLCAPPAATGWEAWPPPPREGGGGASRGGYPRLRRGKRSEAPRRPCIWPGHAGAASAPPAEGRRAWPRRGVE